MRRFEIAETQNIRDIKGAMQNGVESGNSCWQKSCINWEKVGSEVEDTCTSLARKGRPLGFDVIDPLFVFKRKFARKSGVISAKYWRSLRREKSAIGYVSWIVAFISSVELELLIIPSGNNNFERKSDFGILIAMESKQNGEWKGCFLNQSTNFCESKKSFLAKSEIYWKTRWNIIKSWLWDNSGEWFNWNIILMQLWVNVSISYGERDDEIDKKDSIGDRLINISKKSLHVKRIGGNISKNNLAPNGSGNDTSDLYANKCGRKALNEYGDCNSI